MGIFNRFSVLSRVLRGNKSLWIALGIDFALIALFVWLAVTHANPFLLIFLFVIYGVWSYIISDVVREYA